MVCDVSLLVVIAEHGRKHARKIHRGEHILITVIKGAEFDLIAAHMTCMTQLTTIDVVGRNSQVLRLHALLVY